MTSRIVLKFPPLLRLSRTAPPVWVVYLVLSLVLAAQAIVTGPCVIALAAPAGTRVPVLVLEEPETAGIPAELDGATGRSHPMVSRLAKAGYVLGSDLFVLASREPFFSLQAGSDWVSQAVAGVLSRTKAERLDVIAYGITGLASRYAIESGAVPHSRVRNLVMVSSPNRGTFVAELLKSLVSKALLESMWEQSTRSQRYLQLVSGPDRQEAAKDSLKKWVPENTPWEDETSWLIRRSEEVYEPLYARYVSERFYSIPYVPVDSPNLTFAGWLSDNAPKMWESVVLKGTDPPVPAGSAKESPRPGLTSAYYELLAMDVARNQYVVKTAPQKGLLESLFGEGYVPADWKDAAVYYGERLLKHYAGKALVTIKAETQKWLAGQLLRATGFGGDPGAPLLGSLIREDILVNLGKSAGHRFERIRANASLIAYNQDSSRNSATRSTRYISVVGQTVNPWGIFWPQIGPNDMYCEVDCAVPPLGPLDIVKVFRGWFSPSHNGLRDDKAAQDFIVSAITGADKGAQYSIKPSHSGPSLSWVTVSSWRPTYLVAEESGKGEDSWAVATVSVPDPPTGWGYLLWTEDESGVVYDPVRQPVGGAVDVGFHKGKRLGIRLVRSGPANPVTVGGKVDSAFSNEVQTRVQVSVRPSYASVGGEPGKGSVYPPEGGGSGQGGGTGNGTGSPEGQVPSDQVPGLADLPMVRVVYRSKQTTLKDPSETYHEWWSVDWGDGSHQLVSGQVSLEMTHRYAKEGTYEAVLTSYGPDGKKILSKTFELYVSGEDDREKTVRCESIPRVPVDVILSGPAKWITGKPAQYKCQLWTDLPSGVEVVEVTFDPGPEFLVLWERAGDFTVSAAAVVRLRYVLEDKEITVKNTYVQSMPVTVLTTGVTR